MPPDPDTDVSAACFAIVRGVSGRRKRLPAPCVDVCASEAEARWRAALDPSLRPAEVLGPSKSSEGQFVYYLLRWLDH